VTERVFLDTNGLVHGDDTAVGSPHRIPFATA